MPNTNKRIEYGWETGFWRKWDKCFPTGGESRYIQQGNTIIHFIRHLLAQCEKDELEFLKRIKLEVDTVVCDCGEPYKDSDLADLINERLQTQNK